MYIVKGQTTFMENKIAADHLKPLKFRSQRNST